jgi:hypothetical protein
MCITVNVAVGEALQNGILNNNFNAVLSAMRRDGIACHSRAR